MADVTDLNDHMSLTCANCGSANFALLRSGKVECQGCGGIMPCRWSEAPHETETDNTLTEDSECTPT